MTLTFIHINYLPHFHLYFFYFTERYSDSPSTRELRKQLKAGDYDSSVKLKHSSSYETLIWSSESYDNLSKAAPAAASAFASATSTATATEKKETIGNEIGCVIA